MTVHPAPRTPPPAPRACEHTGDVGSLTPLRPSPKPKTKKNKNQRSSLSLILACLIWRVRMAFLARLSALAGTVEADVCEMKAAGMTVKTCCVCVRSHAHRCACGARPRASRPPWRGPRTADRLLGARVRSRGAGGLVWLERVL